MIGGDLGAIDTSVVRFDSSDGREPIIRVECDSIASTSTNQVPHFEGYGTGVLKKTKLLEFLFLFFSYRKDRP